MENKILIFSLIGLSVASMAFTSSMDPAEKKVWTMFEEYQSKLGHPPVAEPKGILDSLERGETFIVDVREPKERAISHIPGSITRQEYEALPLAQRKEKSVAVYCTIGYRSGKFVLELQKQGIKAANLKGSILGWTHYHLPLVNEDGPTHKVHVFGEQWNYPAKGYEGVW